MNNTLKEINTQDKNNFIRSALNLLICLLIVSFAQIAFSREKDATTHIINGSTKLSNTNFVKLTVNGCLEFDNLEIKRKLTVNGSLEGEKLVCETLKVNGAMEGENIQAKDVVIHGSMEGEDIHIKNNLKIQGNLEAKNITVLGETEVGGKVEIKKGEFDKIQLASGKATFENTKINHIFIERGDTHRPQIIELRDGSIVAGDINFDTEGNEVRLFGNSVIKGKVTGAKVITK